MPVTPKTYVSILKYGTQAEYNALATPNANFLYFTSDTGKIYKGTVDYTNNVITAANTDAVSTPVAGKIYVFTDGSVQAYVGGQWKVLGYPKVDAIDSTNEASTDKLPSVKAVVDYVADRISTLTSASNTVSAVAAASSVVEGSTVYTPATIRVTQADNTSSDVEIKGVVTTPTWNASTRTLTLPVTGGTAVQVEIGKDIFLDSAANNRYDTTDNKIHLFLNDDNNTEIEIPAGDLVDTYSAGTDTNTVSVDVTNNEITANVIVKANDASFTNALQVDNVNGGLFVDLSSYVTGSQLSTTLGTTVADVVQLKTDVQANEDAITLLNNNDQTPGSVDYKIAQAISGVNTTTGNLSSDITTLTGRVDQNEADIAALAAATTGASAWGTFA